MMMMMMQTKKPCHDDDDDYEDNNNNTDDNKNNDNNKDMNIYQREREREALQLFSPDRIVAVLSKNHHLKPLEETAHREDLSATHQAIPRCFCCCSTREG